MFWRPFFSNMVTGSKYTSENDWEVFQDDQKTAFLNADIKGKWIQLPDGKYIFITKALYGLRESPRKWFLLYRDFILEEGFQQSSAEPCLFFKKNAKSTQEDM